MVEDNRADIFLIQEALETAAVDAELHIVQDGAAAMAFLDAAEAGMGPCPNLVLLDLNLPKRSGTEVLEYLRQMTKCRDIRVLIVTSSDSEYDRAAVRKLGANGYFRKPSELDEFLKLGSVVKELLKAE